MDYALKCWFNACMVAIWNERIVMDVYFTNFLNLLNNKWKLSIFLFSNLYDSGHAIMFIELHCVCCEAINYEWYASTESPSITSDNQITYALFGKAGLKISLIQIFISPKVHNHNLQTCKHSE
jgi:hypothetical protein